MMLDGQADLLMRDREPLPVGRRAVALLRMLVEHAGEVVAKEDLIAGVWGGLAVEDCNLTAQIAALRRVFAREAGSPAWIETLPRRGYRFVGPLSWETPPAATIPASRALAQARAAEGAPSLAVLSLRVSDPDPVPRYLADGLAEDITSSLSCLAELTVISRGSTLRYRDTDTDLPRIGHELGVRYIVGGSVRRAGPRLRVIAELAEAATGAIVSSRVIETETGMLFEVQDRLVAQIVQALAPRVRDEELRRISLKPPESLVAYDLLLKARALIYRLDRDSLAGAEPLLDRAIALAPGYAAAYTLRAQLHSLRLGQGWSDNRKADAQAVEQFARQAVDRDPADARALARYAHSRSLLHRDYPAALGLFERALTGSPNNADAWMWSSYTLSYLGEGSEAIERAERALRLSPRDWFEYAYYEALCLACYTAGAYDEAVRWGMASIADNPRYLSNMGYTIAALVALGELTQARTLVQDLLLLKPDARVGPVVSRHPYLDPERRVRYGQHLRDAGLPE